MTKKAIGLEQYLSLPEDQQLDILHRDGVYVGKRKIGEQVVVLLQLYGFYVEVYYTHYRREIERTIASSNPDVLQPYIDQVNVKELDRNKNKG